MEIMYILYGLLLIVSTILSLKIVKLYQIFVLHFVINFLAVLLLQSHKDLYGLGLISTYITFFVSIKFLKDKYNVDTIYSIEGLVHKIPLFSFIFRGVTLMLGLFPPFLHSNIVYLNLLTSKNNVVVLDLILLLLFDFIVFMRLTNNIIFGKPNDKIVYIDISKFYSFFLILLLILNISLGVYILLNI
ncbi:hypothetical protein [Sulfurihydrogenibium sp.]|uniref:hypothetical protein n=1 Tax=Sulfurihydrogenibium sp. TaxID=2053621 RepID=UPI00262494C4|nr:hypothetical protein [Sulfurihydrogenibium sp.]